MNVIINTILTILVMCGVIFSFILEKYKRTHLINISKDEIKAQKELLIYLLICMFFINIHYIFQQITTYINDSSFLIRLVKFITFLSFIILTISCLTIMYN
jgi:hypothetical protein